MMRHRPYVFLAVAAACALCAAGVSAGEAESDPFLYEHARVRQSAATALDTYVAAPDSHYKWVSLNKTYSGLGWKGMLLNVTSQLWMPASDVGSGSIWWHQLLVIIPNTIVNPNVAALWITGGDNDGATPPSTKSEDIIIASSMATGAGIVTAALFQIPNQPIMFPGDPTRANRTEDAVLAWGWRKYIDEVNANQPADPRWLPRLPMTKAAVRALDTITAYAGQSDLVADALEAGGHDRDSVSDADSSYYQFVVAGASKRGWTTWTTTAVDKRVIAMIPVVLDALHVRQFMHTMIQAYGGWTFALADYYALNITRLFDTKGFAALQAIVDPATYLPRFGGIPKLVVDATGDEFLMPMDDATWWNDLPGPKHRLMVQNTDHSLATGIVEVLDSVVQWMSAFTRHQPHPDLTWEVSADGTEIAVNATMKPIKAQVWVATTLGMPFGTKARDFRMVTNLSPCPFKKVDGSLCLMPIHWNATSLSPLAGSGGLAYRAHVEAPKSGDGWLGFLIELQFRSHDLIRPFIFTTQCSLVPRSPLPFPDCQADGGPSCQGRLL